MAITIIIAVYALLNKDIQRKTVIYARRSIMYKSAILVVTVVCITTLLAFASAENVERRQIVAVRVQTPPKIDGILSDSVWEEAQPSEGFIQSKPDMGEPMNQQTAIRIIYDDENIYLGIQCYDSEPEKVIGTEMRRDHEGVWEINDYVRFVLDTYHDLRSAYYFGTNPLGAQVDSRVTENGNFHMNWDAVWDCAATRHSQGWSAEFSIPFRQLRYPDKEKHVWGFNCARSLQRSDEWGCWSSIEVKRVTTMSGAGELVGLENIPRSRGLEIRPTAVSGAEVNYSSETDVDSIKKPSIDVKYGLTSELTLDATANTDFAQVEADEEKVNLSRFDIFFEEKRPFFLEGVGIFDFPMSLFYSRRIGSAEGKEAPILGGLKLTGKVGKQSLGLLSVQTDEVDETPSTNFSALRLQRDILRSSTAGIMFLNKAPWEGEGDNQTLGVDLRFKPSEVVEISSSLGKTWTEGMQGRDMAGQINGRIETEHTEVNANFRDVQENFNPEMGFVSRRDIRRGELEGRREFMLHKGGFRSISSGGEYGVTLNHDGGLEYRHTHAYVSWSLETGDSGYTWSSRDWEYLDKDWEIRKGLIIPSGLHRWDRYGFYMGTAEHRRLGLGVSFNTGEFYSGERKFLSLDGHVRPIPKLLINYSYNRNTVDLPDGSFTTNTINSRTIYTFSPDLFVKLFLQWNDDSDVIRGNLLFRYTYRPGSDFYIVYNELWSADEVKQRSIVAKVTYFLNI